MGIVLSTIGEVLPYFNLNTSRNGINKLPPEIMMKIFGMLENKDLANVVCVCSRWKELGECLWAWDTLVIERGDLDMLGIKRVEHVEAICVEYDDWSEEELIKLFEFLGRLIKLDYLDMGGISLEAVNPSLLVKPLVETYFVDLSFCELTGEQLNHFFEAIDDSCEIRSLEMKGVDMSAMDKDILAVGANHLEFVNLYQTQLDVEQVTALLREAGRVTQLRALCLDSNTIEGDPILHRVEGEAVDEDIVNEAKKNIGKLNLKYDFDNNPQWSTFKAGKIVCYVTGQ